MFARLGHLCYRRRRVVVVMWLLAVVAGLGIGGQVFGRLGVNYSGSSVESFAGYDRLSESSQYGSRVTAIVDGPRVDDPGVATAVKDAAGDLAHVRGVARVLTMYTAPEQEALGLVSPAKTASLVQVDLRKNLDDTVVDNALTAIRGRLHKIEDTTNADVFVGGNGLANREINHQSQEDTRRGETVALPVVLVLMIVIFGGIIAAAIPLIGAVGAIAGSLATLYAASYLIDLDPSVPSVTTVLGLGLSIDYALLMLSRYREERGRGLDPETAVVATMETAGRTITFSGLTVAVSLSGLLLFDVAVFQGLATAGASAVIFAMITGLTLVPALIAISGRRIRTPTKPLSDDGPFARLARTTQRFPIVVVLVITAALLSAASPFLHARYQNGTVDLLPRSSESRELAETVAARFPSQAADPVQIVVRGSVADLRAYRDALADQPAVARLVADVGEPLERGKGYAELDVVPKGTSQGDQAQDLVRTLREHRPPMPSWVTGDAAVLVDFKSSIAAGLPWAAAWVALATLVLLFLMTGSVLVPVKALVMNTLSLGATFGALVFVFQDGHLADLLNFTPVSGLETWVPVVTFSFAFGLSMDYEVFLLARIKELYDRGLRNDRAVELGLQRSGRIITSAALVMVIVCLGFATGELLGIKELGTALAVAVAVDATLVRCLLVPATMTLLGDWNWWAPGPLRRFHARFGLHEHGNFPSAPATVPVSASAEVDA